MCEALVAAASREPLVGIETSTAVTGVEAIENGYRLELSGPDGTVPLEAGQVVNCSWESRRALDLMATGTAAEANYRVKHQVLVAGGDTESLEPVTLVQGPYGDVVPRQSGDVYVSWYPVGRTWFGDRPDPEMSPSPEVAEATLEGVAELFPALADFAVADHGPCHIVATVDTSSDIADPGSGLHARLPAGIGDTEGWWSLSGGKLTTAPLASERCAALITGTGVAL